VRVTILGTRGNVTPSARGQARHAGVLVGSRVLLELGVAAYLKLRPRQLFLTHLHPDHFARAAPGALAGVRVYAPEYDCGGRPV
jgi:glyoxylase-like metal-dependent hydrolase (beta-lactamase superfamily II)